MRKTAILMAVCTAFAAVGVKAEEFVLTPPTADRWHYSFNSSPGTRTVGSSFMAPGWAGINGEFNDRDAFVIFAWDTSALIAPGADPATYDVSTIELTVTNLPGAIWEVDFTPDEWYTYDLNGDQIINADGFPRGHASDTDGESDDADPGRTVEVYGVGFGPTYTAASWTETSFYVGSSFSGAPFFGDPVAARDPFPFVYQAGTLDVLHVEDHIRALHNDMLVSPVFEFTPEPWAIGVPIGYTPGNQPVPFDIVFNVDMSLSGGEVKRYFQEQLAAGKVYLIVSSAQETGQMATQENYPSLYMREAVGFLQDAKPASLRIEIGNVPGDYDADGDVDLDDFLEFTPCLTGPAGMSMDPDCAAFDFDGDEDIDLADFAAFQGVLD